MKTPGKDSQAADVEDIQPLALQSFLQLVSNSVNRLFPVLSMAKKVYAFLEKLVFWPQSREIKNLEAVKKHLENTKAVTEELRLNGVSQDEIAKLYLELSIPVITANAEAMIFLRNVEERKGTEINFILDEQRIYFEKRLADASNPLKIETAVKRKSNSGNSSKT